MTTIRPSRLAVLYAGTIFLSAFLLFEVQPLISRFILPWFGGGPAIWTTCLVFFQTLLFAGYAYAHVSEHSFRPKQRTVVHLALIGAALLTLPISPADAWKPDDSSYPTARILVLLTVCVGLPYFVLSSTGPLVQAWFARSLPGRSPYRLYSLSNLGSLLALLTYPFVVEPALDGPSQSLWWTVGFVIFALLSGTACWQTSRLGRRDLAETGTAAECAVPAGIVPPNGTGDAAGDAAPPSLIRRMLWLALPALASVLLLATTNHICLDMSPMPFLWVVPLALYLLSFIIAFDHERWYRRLPYALGALIAVYLTVGMNNPRGWSERTLGIVHYWTVGASDKPWNLQIGYGLDLTCQLIGLFLLCMLCHGELVRLRPTPRYLTSFYLMIAAGGAVGGLSVSLVAPLVFHTYFEWKIGLVVGFLLAATVAFLLGGSVGTATRNAAPGTTIDGSRASRWRRMGWRGALRGIGLAAAGLALVEMIALLQENDFLRFPVLKRARNFYGTLTVIDERPNEPEVRNHVLYNGTTKHGTQLVDPRLHATAASYYSDRTGVGRTILYYRKRAIQENQPLRLGAVGLGAGTLAHYVYLPRHTIHFYEINPAVLPLADEFFTYLADARQRGAKVEVVLGDARLSMERELKEGPQQFDVLVLDAFSSDSIPVHLLTKEAFETYLGHLTPEGALAVHISNRYLDLAPVMFGLAEELGLRAVILVSRDLRNFGWRTEWIILSRNEALMEQLHPDSADFKADPPQPPFPVWTDQRHNLLELIRFK